LINRYLRYRSQNTLLHHTSPFVVIGEWRTNIKRERENGGFKEKRGQEDSK
jgi:hypothetical protein